MEEKKRSIKWSYLIPTILIAATILFVGWYKTYQSLDGVKNIVKSVRTPSKMRENILKFESQFDSAFDMFNQKAVDFEASVEKLNGSRMLSTSYYDLLRDSHGYFHRVLLNPLGDKVRQRAESVIDLSKLAKKHDINLLYTQVPPSVVRDRTEMPAGLHPLDNDYADEMLQRIGEEGITTLDLRETLITDETDIDSLYNKGDHHWCATTAQDAAIDVKEAMNKEFGYKLDPKGIYSNKENYKYKTYKGWFAGSFNRAFGEDMLPYDDATWITPKFDTDFVVTVMNKDQVTVDKVKKGRLEDTVMDKNGLYKHSPNCSGAYLRGGSNEVRLENKKADNDHSVLIISTSFGRPFTAFFCNFFKKVYYVDLQGGRFQGDIFQYVEKHKPDTILVLGSTFSLTKSSVWNYHKSIK